MARNTSTSTAANVLFATFQHSPFTGLVEEVRRRGAPVEDMATHHFTMMFIGYLAVAMAVGRIGLVK